MKRILLSIILCSLLINGTGALYGGYQLIAHPDGSSIQLPLSLLKDTFFSNYLIPGIVLFIANGIFSVVVIVMIFVRMRYYTWYIIAQGAILMGWLIIEILLIKEIYFLQFVLGAMGLMLIICGVLLQNEQKSAGK